MNKEICNLCKPVHYVDDKLTDFDCGCSCHRDKEDCNHKEYPMNKECCSECGHHGVGCIPSCYPTHCHNKACPCHTDRGGIGTINMHIQPTEGGNGAVQPENNWEKRFQITLRSRMLMNNEGKIAYHSILFSDKGGTDYVQYDFDGNELYRIHRDPTIISQHICKYP